MDHALSYPRFVLCIKPHEKRPIRQEINFSKSIENGHFSQKSKGVTKVKFSKMANFLVNFQEAKK